MLSDQILEITAACSLNSLIAIFLMVEIWKIIYTIVIEKYDHTFYFILALLITIPLFCMSLSLFNVIM